MPTDTVYGIACSAFKVDAIKKIYEIKGRNYSKPLPILMRDSSQLGLIAKDIPKETKKLIDRYWPGPLTLVLKTNEMALAASRGKDTIAVRVPDHGVIRQVLDSTGIPLAATSANLSGEEAISSGKKIREVFADLVDLILDGGDCKVGTASSVVDATHYPFTVLREAAISKKNLLETLER